MLLQPPPSPTGLLRYEWIDPTDTLRDLTLETSPALFVSRGSIGMGGAGVEISDQKLPTSPGAVILQVSTKPTRLEIPITILGSSLDGLATTLALLRRWFRTGDERSRHPGYFRITWPNGTVRQWLCYYAGGLEGDLSRGSPAQRTVVVSLYAPDPHPTDAATTVVEWEPADFGHTVSVLNPGEYDAYPIWQITGPSTNMSVENQTTGKAFSLVYPLLSGKTVTIDTRPPSLRFTLPIKDSDGVNRANTLFTGSVTFGNWLVPGTNNLLLTLVDTSAATRVQVTYLPAYDGGLG